MRKIVILEENEVEQELAYTRYATESADLVIKETKTYEVIKDRYGDGAEYLKGLGLTVAD